MARQPKAGGKGNSAASVYGNDSTPAPGKKTATEKRYGAPVQLKPEGASSSSDAAAAGETKTEVSRPGVIAEVSDSWDLPKKIGGVSLALKLHRKDATLVKQETADKSYKAELGELKVKFERKVNGAQGKYRAKVNMALAKAQVNLAEPLPGLKIYMGAKLLDASLTAEELDKIDPATFELGFKGDITKWAGPLLDLYDLSAGDLKVSGDLKIKLNPLELGRVIRLAKEGRKAAKLAAELKAVEQKMAAAKRESEAMRKAIRALDDGTDPKLMELLEKSEKLRKQELLDIAKKKKLSKELFEETKRLAPLEKKLATPLGKSLAGAVSRSIVKRIMGALNVAGWVMTLLELSDAVYKLTGNVDFGKVDDTPMFTRGEGPEGGPRVAPGEGAEGSVPGTGEGAIATEPGQEPGTGKGDPEGTSTTPNEGATEPEAKASGSESASQPYVVREILTARQKQALVKGTRRQVRVKADQETYHFRQMVLRVVRRVKVPEGTALRFKVVKMMPSKARARVFDFEGQTWVEVGQGDVFWHGIPRPGSNERGENDDE